MSGGYFNYYQYHINNIYRDIEEVIINNDNDSLDWWGELIGRGYSWEEIQTIITSVDGKACKTKVSKEKTIKGKLLFEPMKKYKTILADPPWPIKWNASKAIGKKHLDYMTMTISEICALNVKSLAAEDCTLFMWTTNAFLPEAFGVVRHWRFHYKMLYTWCKNNGMGGHPRNATEHMIIATRGESKGDKHAPMILNWMEHPRMKHSQKPEAIRDIIERISPAPRLELFARDRVLGWDVWGNEVNSDIDITQYNQSLGLTAKSNGQSA